MILGLNIPGMYRASNIHDPHAPRWAECREELPHSPAAKTHKDVIGESVELRSHRRGFQRVAPAQKLIVKRVEYRTFQGAKVSSECHPSTHRAACCRITGNP